MEAVKIACYVYFHMIATHGFTLWGMKKKTIKLLCNFNKTENHRVALKKNQILILPSVYILNCLKYILKNKQKYTEFPNHSMNEFE